MVVKKTFSNFENMSHALFQFQTYATVATDYDPSYITRGCLYKRKQQNKMCDGHSGIKDVRCCDGNLCNKADAATHVQFITVLLITTSALVTMLFVMI